MVCFQNKPRNMQNVSLHRARNDITIAFAILQNVSLQKKSVLDFQKLIICNITSFSIMIFMEKIIIRI